jgi:hypothetical protein
MKKDEITFLTNNLESKKKNDIENIFGIDLNDLPSMERSNGKPELVIEDQYHDTLLNDSDIFSEKQPFNSSEKINCGEAVTPIEFFQQFFTKQFVKAITIMSNIHRSKAMPDSEDFSVGEILKYIGIRFYMSICNLPEYEMYWERVNNKFGQPAVYNTMSKNRFDVIKSNFSMYKNNDHLKNNKSSTLAESAINYFNKIFSSKYIPGRDLSLDEGICPWKGKLKFKTFNPMKPEKYGIKSCILCDSKSGYCLKLKICSESSTVENIVMNLIDGYKWKNHIVYMDNYYNSVRLTELLLSNGIYICGTLRQYRGTSESFEEQFKKMKKEEIFYEINTKYIVGGYYDKKPIMFISSFHQPTNDLKEKLVKKMNNVDNTKVLVYSKKTIEIPTALKEYNKYMGGVDLCDQMSKYYTCVRKSKTWIRKFQFYLIEIALYNSFIVYKKN